MPNIDDLDLFLDFITGEVKNESWHVFGYDRIVSASLKTLETPGAKASDQPERKVLGQQLRLRLLDGTEILDITERFDDEDSVYDTADLDRLTAMTSGMGTWSD